MYLNQASRTLAKVRATSSTDAAYPSRPPTTTTPADDGVITLDSSTSAANPEVPQLLMVIPYVLGVNNDTASIRVLGWDYTGALWLPKVLCEYDYTAGNVTGVAGSTVLNTEFFADPLTLVASMGTNNEGTTKVSPANDTPAHFLVSVKGVKRVEFLFKKGVTPTSMNALYKSL
jgi:hypothetical protein